MLKVGSKFKNFEELSYCLQDFQRIEQVQLWVRDSRTVAAAAKRARRKSLNPDLKYAELTYSCVFGGRRPSDLSKAINQTSAGGCPFKVRISTSNDGQELVVKEICHSHNHEPGKKLHEENRRLTPNQSKKFMKAHKSKGNPVSNIKKVAVKNSTKQLPLQYGQPRIVNGQAVVINPSVLSVGVSKSPYKLQLNNQHSAVKIHLGTSQYNLQNFPKQPSQIKKQSSGFVECIIGKAQIKEEPNLELSDYQRDLLEFQQVSFQKGKIKQEPTDNFPEFQLPKKKAIKQEDTTSDLLQFQQDRSQNLISKQKETIRLLQLRQNSHKEKYKPEQRVWDSWQLLQQKCSKKEKYKPQEVTWDSPEHSNSSGQDSNSPERLNSSTFCTYLEPISTPVSDQYSYLPPSPISPGGSSLWSESHSSGDKEISDDPLVDLDVALEEALGGLDGVSKMDVDEKWATSTSVPGNNRSASMPSFQVHDFENREPSLPSSTTELSSMEFYRDGRQIPSKRKRTQSADFSTDLGTSSGDGIFEVSNEGDIPDLCLSYKDLAEFEVTLF